MNTFVFQQDRDRFRTAWALTRRTLGAIVGEDPSTLCFDRRCRHCGHQLHGKPRLVGAPVHFSITHAADRVLLAVCPDHEVGIDVEPAAAAVAGVADFLLHPTEQDADPAEFVRLWVRKEAILKATGHGLTTPMTSFAARTAPDGFFLQDLPQEDGYVAAVAAVTRQDCLVDIVRAGTV